MKKLSVLAIALMLPFIMAAQINQMRYKVNFAVLQAIEEYEAMLMINEDRLGRYLEQFESPDVKVYNDLLGLSYKPVLTASEYAEAAMRADNLIKSKIVSVKKSNMAYTPTGYEVVVNFSKSMEYTDNRGALYSASEFYGSDYEISVKFVYDEDQDKCLIREITGTVNSDKVLQENHLVLERNARNTKNYNRYSDVTFNDGQHLVFNKVNQMFIPDNLKYRGFRPDIKVSDSDIFIKKVTNSKGLTELKFSPRRGRLGGYYGMTVLRDLTFDKSDDYQAVESSATEYGAQLGVMFGTAEKLRAGFTIAAGQGSGTIRFLGKSTIINSVEKADYSELRMLVNKSQEITYTYNTASFAFNLVNSFSPRLAMNIDVICKVYLDGLYELGSYDFTCVDLDRFYDSDGQFYDSVRDSKEYSVSSYASDKWVCMPEDMPMTITGALGLSFYLSRSICISAKAAYEAGINNSFEISNRGNAGYYDTNTNMVDSPLISDGLARKGALWVQGGLTLKF